jgi:hypothetical protein
MAGRLDSKLFSLMESIDAFSGFGSAGRSAGTEWIADAIDLHALMRQEPFRGAVFNGTDDDNPCV